MIHRLTQRHDRLCRTLGTIFGLGGSSAVLWYWWPEAHGYFTNPLAIFILGIAVLTDLAYPFCLMQVRKTEVILPDGRIVRLEKGSPPYEASKGIKKM